MLQPTMPKPRSWEWWQFPEQLRFLLAGAYNTAFGYLVFALIYALLGTRIHYLAVGVMSQAVAIVSAFLVYRRFVFRTEEPWWPNFLRFNASQTLAFVFGLAGLYILVQFGRMNPLVAQALVIACSVTLTYLLHRHYSFRKR